MRNASQWVMDGMTSCIPKGCPLPFTEVVAAHFTKKQVVVADVRMFDGLMGTIEVSRVPFGLACQTWSFEWKVLPGGPANWNGTCWERVNRFSQPAQLALDLA